MSNALRCSPLPRCELTIGFELVTARIALDVLTLMAFARDFVSDACKNLDERAKRSNSSVASSIPTAIAEASPTSPFWLRTANKRSIDGK